MIPATIHGIAPARPRGGTSPQHDTPAEPARKAPPDTSPRLAVRAILTKGYRRSLLTPPQPANPAASVADYCAADLSRMALRLGERAFGLDHPTAAATLDNVALIYTVLWRCFKEGPHYRRALSATNHFGQGQNLFRSVVPYIFEV